jgi:hypothetical protein
MTAVRQALVALAVAAALAGSSVALAAGSLTGIFTTSVKGKTPASLNGDWAMQIKGTGAYQIAKRVGNSGQVVVTGHATIAGRKITFQKETGPAACKGKVSVGRYGWSLKGTRLTFVRYADKCTGRRTILGGTFTKVG